jgi:hypothetical protein
MNKKKLIALLVSVVALVLLQREFLIPMAKDVATKTDLFLIDSNDRASMLTQSNEMTQFAFQHCNTHLKAELEGKNVTVILPEKPLNAWSLGNYEYVVSAEAGISATDPTQKHKYVCRISFKNGDDISGAADFNNWSLDGLSKVVDGQ